MVVTCEHVWTQVSDYLESEVDAVQRAAMDEHLRGCPKCRSVLEGTRNVVQLYGDERLVQLPMGFSGRMQKTLARTLAPRRVYGRVWALAAAAMVLVVGGASVAGYAQRSDPDLKSKLARPAKGIAPDLHVVVAKGGKIFHLSTCSVIHAKAEQQRPLTAQEAVNEGYVPCIYCLAEYVARTASELRRKWLA
jgi:hypothetical protein